MIISFTVRNYKSIKDEVTMHFGVDNLDGVLADNIAFPDKNGKIAVLRSAGVWGPNASGKSNLLEALEALQSFVATSHKNELDQLIDEYQPFKLDPASDKIPIFFELDFIGRNQEHYIYTLEFLNNRVLYECLEFYASAKASILFRRELESDRLTMKFGSKLSGGKVFSCRDNQGYLSVAAQEQKSSNQIKEVFRHIRDDIQIISPEASLFSPKNLLESDYLKSLSALLACADTGIYNVKAKEEDIDFNKFPLPISDELKLKITNDFKWQPQFFHNDTEVEFSKRDESSGTLRLYHISPMILLGLGSSITWIFDEIDCKLHPRIVATIIRLFHDKTVNGKNPQLIFTSHNTGLMDSDLFRREQIWFTQKNPLGVTELTCLDEYNQVRADTNFEKWYRDGRFDAVPDTNYGKLREIIAHSVKSGEDAEANNERCG